VTGARFAPGAGGWETFRELGAVGVPRRADQAATLLTLVPFEAGSRFRVVDVGCGEGHLAAAMLEAWPDAAVLALDGDEAMLAEAARRLRTYGARASVERFELSSDKWFAHVERAGTVLSSLCLHHLDGDSKRELFAAIGTRLSSPGALLIADLVEPKRAEARALYAATYDQYARLESRGSEDLYDRFIEAEWNYYRYPDETDTPSGLFEQLRWLEEAGFVDVDCFWLDAGHAIYGGYTSHAGSGIDPEAASRAVEIAYRAR
jgi:tRNA (cmo5U34)-methyltransferase